MVKGFSSFKVSDSGGRQASSRLVCWTAPQQDCLVGRTGPGDLV